MFNLTAEILRSNDRLSLVKVSSHTHDVNIYVGDETFSASLTKGDLVKMIKDVHSGDFDYAIPYQSIYAAANGLVVWDYSDHGFGKPLYLGAILHCIEGMARAAVIHPYA